jgi:hypothetical protein
MVVAVSLNKKSLPIIATRQNRKNEGFFLTGVNLDTQLIDDLPKLLPEERSDT